MHKQIKEDGQLLPFTCYNTGFKTDISKGFVHADGQSHLGSVTQKPLYEDAQSKMFLEYVISTDGDSCYWFMWYNSTGTPLIRASAVIDENAIGELLKLNIFKH